MLLILTTLKRDWIRKKWKHLNTVFIANGNFQMLFNIYTRIYVHSIVMCYIALGQKRWSDHTSPLLYLVYIMPYYYMHANIKEIYEFPIYTPLYTQYIDYMYEYFVYNIKHNKCVDSMCVYWYISGSPNTFFFTINEFLERKEKLM